MNNRLKELPEWADEPLTDSEEEDEEEEGDIEEGKTKEPKPKTPEEIERENLKVVFFQAITSVQKEIIGIAEATAQIEQINEDSQKALTTETETVLSRKLRKVIDGSNKKAKGVKNLLAELKSENEQLKADKKVTESDMR